MEVEANSTLASATVNPLILLASMSLVSCIPEEQG